MPTVSTNEDTQFLTRFRVFDVKKNEHENYKRFQGLSAAELYIFFFFLLNFKLTRGEKNHLMCSYSNECICIHLLLFFHAL